MNNANVQTIRFSHRDAKFVLKLSNNGATLTVNGKLAEVEDSYVPGLISLARRNGVHRIVWQSRYSWMMQYA